MMIVSFFVVASVWETKFESEHHLERIRQLGRPGDPAACPNCQAQSETAPRLPMSQSGPLTLRC